MPTFIFVLLAMAFVIAMLLVIGMCRVSKMADEAMEREHQANLHNNTFRDTLRFGKARYDDHMYGELQ